METYREEDIFPNGDRIVGVEILWGTVCYEVMTPEGDIYTIEHEDAEAYMNSEPWDE